MTTDTYIRKLSALLDGHPVYLYWKGRVALYALLKAMGVGPGDEVIVPGFTCVVVPNAIIYTGARPVYADIDRESMNVPAEAYQAAVTDKTKAIITQNTFGLSYQVDQIAALGKEQKIFTIEDCTHGFGGTFSGQPNGTWCDAAFFSTQWNKPFSTGLGGFALVNNRELLPELEKVNRMLNPPSSTEKVSLWLQMAAHRMLLNDSLYFFLRDLYRWLSRKNLVLGSSQGDELSEPVMPGDYFKSHTSLQAGAGLKALRQINELNRLRKKNAEIYTEWLAANNKYHVSGRFFPDHLFLKYPVLVENQDEFQEAARKHRIQLGDWFNTPLYPVKGNWEKWYLDSSKIPVALEVSRHIVNLPTETRKPQKVISFLEHFKDKIL
ncbi:MAG: hypothetical protein Kow00127_23100 [Bacteroidales bacterium]